MRLAVVMAQVEVRHTFNPFEQTVISINVLRFDCLQLL
jgi:hypothetical protein